MSTKRTYRVMNTSRAFLEYLKSKSVDHVVTEDGKMTELKLYSDTDLFEIAAHYSRRETLKLAAESARMKESWDDDKPENWREEVEVYSPNGRDRTYEISKNSILSVI